jgi:hypothetical protein
MGSQPAVVRLPRLSGTCELHVAEQVFATSPFQEFNLCYEFWLNPNTLPLSSAVKPSPHRPLCVSGRFTNGQSSRTQGFQLLKHHSARCRNKTVSNSSNVDQIVIAVEPDKDRINPLSARFDVFGPVIGFVFFGGRLTSA